MDEEWRPVVIWDGWFSERYEVSNLGRVRSNPNFRSRGSRPGNILFQSQDNHGYKQVYLYRDMKQTTIKVHHLVATSFLGAKPFKYDINHIDSDKTNNNVLNLEYCTHKDNMRHYQRSDHADGIYFFGERLGVPEAVEKFSPPGLKSRSVHRRIYRHGWTPEEAVTTPIRRTGRPTNKEIQDRKKC